MPSKFLKILATTFVVLLVITFIPIVNFITYIPIVKTQITLGSNFGKTCGTKYQGEDFMRSIDCERCQGVPLCKKYISKSDFSYGVKGYQGVALVTLHSAIFSLIISPLIYLFTRYRSKKRNVANSNEVNQLIPNPSYSQFSLS